MAKKSDSGRDNQRHRTRKDLLAAAARLLKEGRTPDMDAVAAEAMVSRATAYRYFPTVEQLLVEAPLDGAVPGPEAVFAQHASSDPAKRVDHAEAALHDMCWRNEAQLRVMLAASLTRPQGSSSARVPIRQNRRAQLIETALAPARSHFTGPAYEKLCAALALIFGTESMIVFKDVLGIDAETARKIKSWAVRSLVNTALQESREYRAKR